MSKHICRNVSHHLLQTLNWVDEEQLDFYLRVIPAGWYINATVTSQLKQVPHAQTKTNNEYLLILASFSWYHTLMAKLKPHHYYFLLWFTLRKGTDPIPKSHNLYPLYLMVLVSQSNVFSNGFLQQINLVSGNGIILLLPHRRYWPVHRAKRLSSLSASFNNAYTQIPLFRDCYFLSGLNGSLYRLINALWEYFFLMYLQCNSQGTICWGWHLFWTKSVRQDDLGREEVSRFFPLLLCSTDYNWNWKSFVCKC